MKLFRCFNEQATLCTCCQLKSGCIPTLLMSKGWTEANLTSWQLPKWFNNMMVVQQHLCWGASNASRCVVARQHPQIQVARMPQQSWVGSTNNPCQVATVISQTSWCCTPVVSSSVACFEASCNGLHSLPTRHSPTRATEPHQPLVLPARTQQLSNKLAVK